MFSITIGTAAAAVALFAVAFTVTLLAITFPIPTLVAAGVCAVWWGISRLM